MTLLFHHTLTAARQTEPTLLHSDFHRMSIKPFFFFFGEKIRGLSFPASVIPQPSFSRVCHAPPRAAPSPSVSCPDLASPHLSVTRHAVQAVLQQNFPQLQHSLCLALDFQFHLGELGNRIKDRNK